MAQGVKNTIRIPASPPRIPYYPWRREELRKLLNIPTDEFLAKYSSRVHVADNLDHMYTLFTDSLVREVESNNEAGKPTRLILPVGPAEQYPLFVKRVVQRKLNLRDCHFFFMDEYCYEDGRPFGSGHPLGLRASAERLLFRPLEERAPGLMIPREQIHFPGPEHPEKMQREIDRIGGIDTCYGGVGVHGHVAFNEPEEGVEHSDTRVLRPNLISKTINIVRADCGGFFGDYPDVAVTIGMKPILKSARILLFPRNRIFATDGSPFQYINTATRVAIAGGIDITPAGDYPVSFCGAQIPGNPERTLTVYATRDALDMPELEISST